MLVPYCMTKRQKNHCFNMVHLRKISLAESRGSSRFFNNKVVSDFGFGHFLKKNHLVVPSLNKFFSQRGNPRI